MPRSVIVVGGGIIGCSIAYELAKAGCRVTVLERSTPGAEASGAAAGLLAALGGSPGRDHFRELALASWRLYPAVVSELRELTGVDVEHMTGGTLYPLFDPGEIEAARLRTTWSTATEFGIEVLEGTAALEREPALAKDIPAVLFVKGDHWVNNERLVTAYASAGARRGVSIRTGAEVTAIVATDGRARGVVADGERLDADTVVLAAGAWSGRLAPAGLPALPVAPVRGQMLAVSNVPPLLSHAVHGHEIYLVPRPSGELLVGATVEHAGFVRAVTPDGIGSLIEAAIRLVPGVGRRAITRTWSGLRPWAPDNAPILGPWPGAEGLVVATAHYRNGILLAPVTAALISQCVLTGKTPAALDPFLPQRFLSKET